MGNTDSTFDIFREADIFKGLNAAQCKEVIARGFSKRLQAHEVLFHQGQQATHCYLVIQGRLKLTKLSQQGKEVIIRYVGAGELAAAVAVLKNGLCPVSATSIHETEVTGWDKATMNVLMHRYPDIAINLNGIILARIEDVQERYLEVCTEQVDQRIARSLLRLMRWAGSRQQDGILINIPLSRQNIADYSGTTLYTVSRTLSAWEKKGWLKSSREKIIIIDPHALVSFAEHP